LLKGFFNYFYREVTKSESKRKMEAITVSVIKKIIFHPHRWMNNLSCHHRSLKTHLIIALNARHHFVSK
jgi:hypothetical protein